MPWSSQTQAPGFSQHDADPHNDFQAGRTLCTLFSCGLPPLDACWQAFVHMWAHSLAHGDHVYLLCHPSAAPPAALAACSVYFLFSPPPCSSTTGVSAERPSQAIRAFPGGYFQNSEVTGGLRGRPRVALAVCPLCPPRSPSLGASPAPGTWPGLPSGVVTGKGGSEAAAHPRPGLLFSPLFLPFLRQLCVPIPPPRICELSLSAQSCPNVCDATDCSPPGSSVHGIPQARILECVAMPSSRGSS